MTALRLQNPEIANREARALPGDSRWGTRCGAGFHAASRDKAHPARQRQLVRATYDLYDGLAIWSGNEIGSATIYATARVSSRIPAHDAVPFPVCTDDAHPRALIRSSSSGQVQLRSHPRGSGSLSAVQSTPTAR